MIGRLHGIVIDTPDPDAAAAFYAELLGMQRVQDEPDWVVIGDAPDRPGVAFQRADGQPASTWPDRVRPQYRHFDVRVDDLEAAGRAVVALGARPLSGGGESFQVYADPDGHPFCLIRIGAAG